MKLRKTTHLRIQDRPMIALRVQLNDNQIYMGSSIYYPLVNEQLDPENHQVLMDTFVFQPQQLPGSNC